MQGAGDPIIDIHQHTNYGGKRDKEFKVIEPGRTHDQLLAHQKAIGNDLTTPFPPYGFPGLKPGDRWCVCITRWKESLEAGMACPVDLEATHMHALEFVDLEDLKRHAIVTPK